MGGKPFVSMKSMKQRCAVTAKTSTFRKHIHYNSLSCITEITHVWDDIAVLLPVAESGAGKKQRRCFGFTVLPPRLTRGGLAAQRRSGSNGDSEAWSWSCRGLLHQPSAFSNPSANTISINHARGAGCLQSDVFSWCRSKRWWSRGYCGNLLLPLLFAGLRSSAEAQGCHIKVALQGLGQHGQHRQEWDVCSTHSSMGEWAPGAAMAPCSNTALLSIASSEYVLISHISSAKCHILPSLQHHLQPLTHSSVIFPASIS